VQIKKVLIVYKRSSYEEHVLHGRQSAYIRLLRQGSPATKTAKRVHQEHRESFATVREVLEEFGIPYEIRLRFSRKPIRGYDLVMTIGGDGTFLETSHFLQGGVLLGFNSAPSESIGFYCRANRLNFRQKLISLLRGRHRFQRLERLQCHFPGSKKAPLVLNDILFTNRNPAGTTRYFLKVGNKKEEQKSSGIWIAPAPGSTAAIHSAGGRTLPLTSSKFQYVIREPYEPFGKKYKMKRGILSRGTQIKLLSMMDVGVIFIDGPHWRFPIKRGDVVTIRHANKPIQVVW